ncbi:MAG: shikimate dehydrogenase [Hyphomicrobiales bacterium]
MKRACVIGDPVSHSRSPLVHGFWLAELKIEGAYGREHVTADRLAAFIRGLGQHGYRGCNVTLPHKEAAFRLVDEATELACALEAVNTIWLSEDGRLHGDNTDVHGFIANLDQEAPKWRSSTTTALVLGAGGSARAVLTALMICGIERVIIANRSLERAAALAAGQPRLVEAMALDRLDQALPETDLLVNTTQLGMAGQPGHEFDLGRLKSRALVADIVYVPLETELSRQARLLGHATVGGLGMLLHQAAPGFEHWFGQRPRVTPALYRHVAADIAASPV